MDEFKNHILKWVEIDTNLKILKDKYQNAIQKEKQKKEVLESRLTNFIIQNNMTQSTIQISDGSIKYSEVNVTSPITYKFLYETFTELFGNEHKANEIIEYIKKKRKIKKNICLKRSKNKNNK